MGLILVGGPSGIGKSAIVDTLVTKHNIFQRPKAYTTRSPRSEKGEETHFVYVDDLEINRLKAAGELLSLDEVHGNKYALSRQSVDDICNQRQIPIKEFYLGDHESLRKKYPNVLSVVVMPISEDSYLKHMNNSPDLQNRLERCASDFIHHEQMIRDSNIEIIIYNDFNTSIEHISDHIYKEFINHSIKNQR